MGMTLQQLMGEGGDLAIQSLAYDSRTVEPGALFFCVTGLREDGHRFAADAIGRGAAALVVERPLGLGVPEVVLPSVRTALPLVASRFYGHPSRQLRTIGITGTDGKTTTAYMLRAILEAEGTPTGLLGTVKAVVGGRETTSRLTTPEAVDIQASLRAMADGGDRACVMEVSSHGLALHRADGIDFELAIFTNLSRDHLDFHGTMRDYFLAKQHLLMQAGVRPVVNADDPYGRLVALRDGAVTFAIDRDADYRARVRTVSPAGTEFSIAGNGVEVTVRNRMHGRHNVANGLAAAAAALELGVQPASVSHALSEFQGVPGRFQRIDEGHAFGVVVDFAHTPAALEQALSSARGLATGRVLCVFGCAGGRDRGTRAAMGQLVSRLADVGIVTTDDPYDEDPAQIARQVREGMDGREVVIADREEAIRHAISAAAPGDLVLIAGRGHERFQQVGTERRELDDAVVARRALRELPVSAPA
jgi:UDP-N-acetylmuramoyl-L-alanyl-D-glutamate--2,6-diaminopimelate ligase